MIEDEPEVRRALATALRANDYDVLELDDVGALLAAAEAGALPPILLADLDLDGTRVVDALPAVFAHAPELSVVAVTGHASDDWLFPAIEAGCVGYVLKTEVFTRLGEVAREVERGGSPMTREISRRLLARLRAPSTRAQPGLLSEREREVLGLLAEGYTYEQVALRLELSIDSVRTYVRRTYGKLGVSTKSEATRRAMRLGLID